MLIRVFAATGGFAFAASLAYSVYFYTAGLERPAAAQPYALWYDSALVTAFALHHSIMARTGAKQWLARIAPPAIERTTYVWVASLLFFATCWLWRRLPGELYHITGAGVVPFYLLQWCGAVSALLGASRLNPLELSGVRQPATVTPPTLHTHGIYGYVRHPLYLGWVLLVWGTPHMTMDRLLFAALTTAYLAIAVPFEERGLVATFGRAYETYRQRVRWRILPGLY